MLRLPQSEIRRSQWEFCHSDLRSIPLEFLRMNNVTEQQWWIKAWRHQKWYATLVAEIKALYASIDRQGDPATLQRIIARADAIEKRILRLKRVMGRHWQRAPRVLARMPSQFSVLVH